VTSTGICGSDLHLYEVFGPSWRRGDILGHEPMGVVAEVGSDVTELEVGGPGRRAVQTRPAVRVSCAGRSVADVRLIDDEIDRRVTRVLAELVLP
jgi:NADPH:quinone reductase-like Zn-dependent oxidoreductase